MATIIGVLTVCLVFWFIFGMIKPQKAAPFLKQASRLKIFGIFLGGIFILGMFAPSSENQQSSNTVQSTSEQKEEQKKVANTEVIKVLGTFYKKIDEVQKSEWYTPYSGNVPAKTAAYWYVGLNSGDYINQRVKLVHFSSGINWVFWDDVIFSTSEKNWKYEIGSFAGQSGGGKSTEIVMGGKYEYLDVPFDKVSKGIEILVAGTNPIIRLEGKQYHYDIKLTEQDIQSLKTALEFEKNAKIIGGKITREQ